MSSLPYAIDPDPMPPQTRGERGLLLAILRRAVMDILGYDTMVHSGGCSWSVRRKAWRWMFIDFGEQDDPDLWTCAWICDMLQIDRGALCRQIKRAVLAGNYDTWRAWISSGENYKKGSVSRA